MDLLVLQNVCYSCNFDVLVDYPKGEVQFEKSKMLNITLSFSRGTQRYPRFGPVPLNLGENGVEAHGAFAINSYIELSKLDGW